MGLTLTTPPDEEPVTVAEFKAHANIDSTFVEDDALIETYLKAARRKTETFLWRQLVEATFTLRIDSFPLDDFIEMPLPPLIEVTSIQYYDGSNMLQTLSPSAYELDAGTEPGRIYIDRSTGWPSTYNRRNAVSILYQCGYGAAADIPDDIKLSILMKAAHAYENREPVAVGVSVAELPQAVQSLDDLNKFRGDLNINRLGLTAPV